jgi:hypothetical protein
VEPGDFRTIGGIGFRDIEGGVGSSDGQWSALNDRNELSVIINFLDGSGGTFLITIPEPASLAYLIVTTSFIAMRRRRRFETDN